MDLSVGLGLGVEDGWDDLGVVGDGVPLFAQAFDQVVVQQIEVVVVEAGCAKVVCRYILLSLKCIQWNLKRSA